MKHLLVFTFFVFTGFCFAMGQAGTLDVNFGNGGIVIDSTLPGQESSRSVAIQPDGKIIAAATLNNGSLFPAFHRFNTNGSPDLSFGTNGAAVINAPGNSCSSAVLQPDGKIVFTGNRVIGNIIYVIAGRVNRSGILDSSFGNNGFSVIKVSDYQAQPYGCAMQNDGKILIVGLSAPVVNQSPLDWFGIRLTINGMLDSSFGNNGKLVTGVTPAVDTRCYQVLVQADKKILLIGARVTNHTNICVGRYLENGTLDTAFGINGFATADFGGNSIATDGVIKKDNKIILCGSSGLSSDYNVVQFLSNGSLDSTFGNMGKVVTDMQGYYDYSRAIYLQPDDKILVSGSSSNTQIFQYDFGTVRYNINGAIDSSFGENGKAITHFSTGDNDPFDMLLQKDGKIIVSGSINSDVDHIALVRYNNDAALPLKFTSFTVTKKENSTLLNWQTTNEINNSYFNIERSLDSKTFSSIGTKQGLNSAATNNYFFADNSPLKGSNYYRLKQVDKDGAFTYSGIASVEFIDGGLFVIAPNPASNHINVIIPPSNTISQIFIYDVTGKKLMSEAIAANITSKQINISGLASGVYSAVLMQNGKKEMMKLVKK